MVPTERWGGPWSQSEYFKRGTSLASARNPTTTLQTSNLSSSHYTGYANPPPTHIPNILATQIKIHFSEIWWCLHYPTIFLPSFLRSLTKSENMRLFSSTSPMSVFRDPVPGRVFIISANIDTHCSLSTWATSKISSSSVCHYKK